MSNGTRRVVITGMGMVSPLGNTVEDSWAELIAGKSGAGPITQFDPSGFTSTFAAEVKDLDLSPYVEHKAGRRMDRFTHLALAAAKQAQANSGIDVELGPGADGRRDRDGHRRAQVLRDVRRPAQRAGPGRVNPFSIVQIIPNLAAGWVSMELGTRGPLLAPCTACAASNMAIGDGLDSIRLGRADVMFCGGTEAPVSRVCDRRLRRDACDLAAERRAGARIATLRRRARRVRDGRGRGGDRPRGARAGQGPRRAHLRGAARLRRLVRRKPRSDPDPTGENPARAIRMALADAGVSPDEVGYVNAHGTSTPAGDSGETRVLKLALGEEKAYATPVSSTKGATGHCLGAAGAVEAIFSILALERGVLPPTINQETPDPECDLDYIPNVAREQQVEIAVSNSFGFGGHNACLVFRRWHGA